MSSNGSRPVHLSRRQWMGACLGGVALGGRSPRAQAPGAVSPRDAFGSGMHLVITGSGAALPVPERGNAGAAVVVDGAIVQIDCGRRTMDNQLLAGINPIDVDHVVFTHLHFDHIGEFGYFLICSWAGGRQTPIDVFGPRGTEAMVQGLLSAHHTDVEFFTKRMQGQGGAAMKGADRPPVRVKEVGAGPVFRRPQLTVIAAETPHIPFLGPQRSLAYRVESKYGAVVVSGDTAPSDAVVDLAKGADVLVHECTLPPPGVVAAGSFSRLPDRSKPLAGTGHTMPAEIGQIAARAGVKKVVATHFGLYTQVPAAIRMAANFFGPAGVGPEVWPAIAAEIKRYYDGPVVLAEDALVIRVG